jgi:hypothetical protein
MPGDLGAFVLGQVCPAVSIYPGPRIPAGGERGQQIVADLMPQVFPDMAGGPQLTNSKNIGAITHLSTVDPEPAGNRAIRHNSCPAGRGEGYAGF